MIKQGDSYYPSEEFKKNAFPNDVKIYEEAKVDPIKFWEKVAQDLVWQKKWKKAFEHNPPFFKWFLGGKINITENILDKNIKIDPNKIAVIWESESLNEESKKITYQELYKEVNKFANALKKLGVKKGDRVGIYLPMIPEVIIAMLGCARIGAVHLVVFSAFSPAALQTRLQAVDAKVLITADGYWRRGQVINLKQNADEGIKNTKVKKVIVVKRSNSEIPFDAKKDLWWHELVANQLEECKAEAIDSEDNFFILPESGTTGQFLPILHTAGGYAVQAYWTGKIVFDFHKDLSAGRQGDILWCMSDAGWVTGHTYAIYSPLLNGITTVIYEGAPDFPTNDRWANIIEKHNVTIFYTAPTAIRMFAKYGAEIISDNNFSKLRVLGSVGEPIDEEAWNWYFKEVGKERCPLVDTWWQTETGGIMISSLAGIGPFKPSFAGLPLPGVNIEIWDESGKECAFNQEGNIVILPPYTPGMLRNIYGDKNKYINTYWSHYDKKTYFTSDGGFKAENGLIRVIGRVDDIIKVAGHRMSTGELESAVSKHGDISESAVIGIPDPIKGEVPVVFAIAENPRPVEELKKEIIENIKKDFGPIALPKEVYIVNDLPKTRSGKITRLLIKKIILGKDLGDLSVVQNPETIDKIKEIIKK